MLRRLIAISRTMACKVFLLLLLNACVIADHHPRLRRQVFDFSSNTPAPILGSSDLSGGGSGGTGGTVGLSFPSLPGAPVDLPEGQNNNDNGESSASAIDLGSLGLGSSSGGSGGSGGPSLPSLPETPVLLPGVQNNDTVGMPNGGTPSGSNLGTIGNLGDGPGDSGTSGGTLLPSLSGTPLSLSGSQDNNETGGFSNGGIQSGSGWFFGSSPNGARANSDSETSGSSPLGGSGLPSLNQTDDSNSSTPTGGNTFNFPDPNPNPTNVGGVVPFPNLNQNANNSGQGVSLGWPLAPKPNDSNSSTPTGIGGVSFLPSLSASNNDSDNSTNTGTGQGGFSLNCSPLRFLLCQSWSCVNGGTCDVRIEPGSFNCKPFCHCPPPFNDTAIYDDLHCQEKDEDNETTTTAPQRPCPLPCGLHGECRWRESPHSQNSLFCHCDAGWVGYSCSTPCAKNCSNNATCNVYEGVEVCECPSPWVGEFCTELPPPEPNHEKALKTWIALGTSLSAGLVVAVVVATTVIHVLWQKRLVFAMRIVYWFQSYEDNDGLKYDAFVSYVSRPQDEDFVYEHLQPRLEKDMGFKICLHQRDFVIGNTIANNIMSCLEESRRFVLLLTPRYLESEWAEFEYHGALQLMLSKKMRIVPVLLEDLGDTEALNPTLKAILQSVTYITHPGPDATQVQIDKFWKRLYLSMPKTQKSKESALNEDPKEVISLSPSHKSVFCDVATDKNVKLSSFTTKNCVENGKIAHFDSIPDNKEFPILKRLERDLIGTLESGNSVTNLDETYTSIDNSKNDGDTCKCDDLNGGLESRDYVTNLDETSIDMSKSVEGTHQYHYLIETPESGHTVTSFDDMYTSTDISKTTKSDEDKTKRGERLSDLKLQVKDDHASSETATSNFLSVDQVEDNDSGINLTEDSCGNDF